MPYVFDTLELPVLGMTVARTGAVEMGMVRRSDGAWVPDSSDTPLFVDGFGVTGAVATGVPYYDNAQVTPGESAVLNINALTGQVWLEV